MRTSKITDMSSLTYTSLALDSVKRADYSKEQKRAYVHELTTRAQYFAPNTYLIEVKLTQSFRMLS